MASVTQPTGFTMGQGFMATIGIVVNNDRCAIVIPMCYQGTPDNDNDVGQSCVDAVVGNYLQPLTQQFSSDAYVSFVQAEGMLVGQIPQRTSFAPTDWPGGESPGPLPSGTCGLIVFYQEAADVDEDTKKIPIGKSFIPGIARDQVVGDAMVAGWVSGAMDLCEIMQNVVTAPTIEPSLNWYRVAGKPKADPLLPPPDASTKVNRIYAYAARGYVCTQRRRMIPR